MATLGRIKFRALASRPKRSPVIINRRAVDAVHAEPLPCSRCGAAEAHWADAMQSISHAFLPNDDRLKQACKGALGRGSDVGLRR